MVEISLLVRTLGWVTSIELDIWLAAEDSIFGTDEMTILLSCSGMIYDNDMPFYLWPVSVLDRIDLQRQE